MSKEPASTSKNPPSTGFDENVASRLVSTCC